MRETTKEFKKKSLGVMVKWFFCEYLNNNMSSLSYMEPSFSVCLNNIKNKSNELFNSDISTDELRDILFSEKMRHAACGWYFGGYFTDIKVAIGVEPSEKEVEIYNTSITSFENFAENLIKTGVNE